VRAETATVAVLDADLVASVAAIADFRTAMVLNSDPDGIGPRRCGFRYRKEAMQVPCRRSAARHNLALRPE
jgi:hypothetical protein